jgi:hypothetical protein
MDQKLDNAYKYNKEKCKDLVKRCDERDDEIYDENKNKYKIAIYSYKVEKVGERVA